MKKILLLIAVTALAVSALGQNCSIASMELSGQGSSGGCDSHTALAQPTSQSKTFTDTCSTDPNAASNPNTQYFSAQSTVTGNGQCETFPTRILNCPPTMTNSIDMAATPDQNNVFHNKAADMQVSFDSNGNGVCTPVSGGTREDTKQCGGQLCASGGGGSGGDCSFVPGPTGQFVTGDPGGDPPPCNCPPGQTCIGPGTGSPIIIDTEGEGFHLTSPVAGVTFDISGTGKPVQMAWTDAHSHNAFLALPGADGLVHNGKELFGNFTPQPPSDHPNGFIALAQYDKPENGGNGDGIIDEHDQVFSQLRLWIDENHDGVCQPNELHRLPELGVYSLALDYKESRRTDQFGNQFRYKARVNPGERQDSRDQRPHGENNEVGRWTYDVFFVIK